MHKTKILLCILSLTIMGSFSACNGDTVNPSSKSSAENSSGITYQSSEASDAETSSRNESEAASDTSSEAQSPGNIPVNSSKSQSNYKTSVSSKKSQGEKPVETLSNFDMWTGNDFWNTGVIYNETVTMYKTKSGETNGFLIQNPSKIVSVKSYDFKTTYKEGKDYKVTGNKITLPDGSAITNVLSDGEYFPSSATQPYSSEFKAGGGFLLYTEDSFIVRKQLCVTYTFDKSKWTGPKPVSAASKLPKTTAKLKAGQKVEISLIGCSTSTGCNSSSYLKIQPFMPPWFELIRQKLAKDYKTDIVLTTFAKGGSTSDYGVSQASSVGAKKPDIVFFEFGMNDGTFKMSDDQYKNNYMMMIDTIRKKSPNTEFVLLAPLLANPDNVQVGTQERYFNVITEISNSVSGVATVDITGINRAMLTGGKRYVDLSANNINHPNDFMQTAMAAGVVSIFK